MDASEIRHYLQLARQAATRAYNPYSGFSVGCVLLAKSQDSTDSMASKPLFFTGCNIESSSYSATLCAERVAASGAIAQGIRQWDSIFVVSPSRVSPCGVCRQFLFEFCPELKIYLAHLSSDDTDGNEFIGPLVLSDLLPWASALQQSSIGRKE